MTSNDHILDLSTIMNMDLADACMSIAEAYKRSNTLVSGAIFAYIAKQLIGCETAPGGPYSKDSNLYSKASVRLNITIGYLFVTLGQPLSKVDTYIMKLDSKKMQPAEYYLLQIYSEAKQAPNLRLQRPKENRPYSHAYKTLNKLGAPAREQALSFLERVHGADSTGEISAIALYTAQSIGTHIPPSILHRLGEANIYSWIAYTIYDHIIDKQTDGTNLPVANIVMRLALDRYSGLFPHDDWFQTVIAQHFDQVDNASAWELQHCRFPVLDQLATITNLPDYATHDILAERSGVHILGPLAVTRLVGYPPEKTARLEKGLRHYLIARQLSDDIHDWREDLAAGHASAVVARLLASQKILPNQYNVLHLTKHLQDDFWRHSMKTINDDIVLHAKQAIEHLLAAGCQPSGKLISLVSRLIEAAKASMKERARFTEFYAAYEIRN